VKAIQFGIYPLRWPVCKTLGLISPGVYWSPLSGLRLRDMPPPAIPGDDWVRIRPLLGGICGTDLAAIFQRNHPATLLRSLTRFPVILGHEGVGVIEEVGSGVTGWQTGQRVCVEPMLSCVPRGIEPLCSRCQAGQISLCENVTEGRFPPGTMIGWNPFTGGTWSESLVAHQSQLFAVPDSVTDEVATLIDPIACAVHVVLRHCPSPGQRALVIGGGIIGLGVVGVLRVMAPNVHVTAIVRHDHQERLARQFGASDIIRTRRKETKAERYQQVADRTGGRRFDALFGNQGLMGGFDVTYDCIGTGESLTDAMKFTHGRGTVVECATSQITVVDTTPLWFAELTVIGSYGRCMEEVGGRRLHTYEVTLEMLRDGRLRLDGLLTHRFPLKDYRHALATTVSRAATGLVKAAFDHRS
jgi:L-iditol 2-dehydrogenase